MKLPLSRILSPLIVLVLLVLHQYLWLIAEHGWCNCWYSSGILPQKVSVMLGTHGREWSYFYTAFTGSWIHGNWEHLLGNVFSLAGLSLLFLLFLRQGWIRFFLIQWFISGIILFFLAPNASIHIGASTWSYSFAGFLSTLAFLHPNRKLLSLFFIICLWYGSMWWGIFPIDPRISYQGHISGLTTGVLVALLGRDFWLNRMFVSTEIPVLESEHGDSASNINPYDQFK